MRKGRVRGSEEGRKEGRGGGGGLMFGPEDRYEAGAPVTAPSISVPLPVRETNVKTNDKD